MTNAVFLDVTLCGSYKADSLEERIAFIITMTRIGELGTTLAVTSSVFSSLLLLTLFVVR
jgi:hypothetical protein